MQTHSDNIFKYAINSFYTQTFHLSRCYKEPLKGMIFFIFSVEPPRICFNLYAEGDIDCNPFYPIYKKPNELISMAINGDLVLHLCRSLRLRTIPVVASGSVLQRSPFRTSPILCLPNCPRSPCALVCGTLRDRHRFHGSVIRETIPDPKWYTDQ